nr:MAG: ORF1 [Anelloviridae sp.]
MPFWWYRRRKPWYTRRRQRRKPRWPKRRKRYYRRQYRRPARRRRRRRRKTKVRRKRQKIIVKQWQPQSIVKCKIKGLGCLVAGSEGRQFFCYTNEISSYPQPKAPGGGGFGCEVYTLEYLYKQWVAHKNIWTKSNDYKDLVRYTGTTITVYRHPTTDFIVSYNTQPPFIINKDTYTDLHPVRMLLSRHHRVILSAKTNPMGKVKTKIKIRPPKQMQTKWYFQENFAEVGLFQLNATACNFGWSYYGPNQQSSLVTFYSLNTNFYQKHNWAQQRTEGQIYVPYLGYPQTNWPTYTYPTSSGDKTITPNPSTYWESIDYDKGFFQWKVLTAKKITNIQGEHQHETPVTIARYNPLIDTGENSYVWVVSIVSDNGWKKPSDHDLIISGKPIWLALFGFWNYILKVKKDKAFLEQAMFVVQSPAIRLVNNTAQTWFPIIDKSFLTGNLPYGETITTHDKKFWYPNALKQQEIINAFVESGPYIPKYAFLKESTWNLDYRYISYFKWGGPQVYDQPVADPAKQETYPVPNTLTEGIQIKDPLTQKYKQMLRAWDFRRGMLTKRALQRITENTESDESLSTCESEPLQKKKKITAEIPNPQEKTEEIQTCLQGLFEKSTCPDTEDLKQLILYQQQQQQQLKSNIISLLLDLKQQQRLLQLQTGIE